MQSHPRHAHYRYYKKFGNMLLTGASIVSHTSCPVQSLNVVGRTLEQQRGSADASVRVQQGGSFSVVYE